MKLVANVLILFGGGGNEHEVSVVSKEYYKSSLARFKDINLIEVEIQKNKQWILRDTNSDQLVVYLTPSKELCSLKDHKVTFSQIDYVIPCLHGYPGETGQLQGLLDIYQIPYFGNGVEASALCMNKISTKLWLTHLDIPVVEFMIVTSSIDDQEINQAKKFLQVHKKVFIKASSEGSSVGVYLVTSEMQLIDAIKKASQYSPFVLIERAIKGREIEVSTYQYGDAIIATKPGEIHCPKEFYDYEEKYSKNSNTTTSIIAKDLSDSITKKMHDTCVKIFRCLKLKDLSRIDFFLENDSNFYVNEINTFPGSTPISLFPQMMKNHGHDFSEFLYLAIQRDLKSKNGDHL
jgi:D-alanine-D-alanine ligase